MNEPNPHAREPDDGYLWDRTGAPDPDVERLERVLRPVGADTQRPGTPCADTSRPAPAPTAVRRRWLLIAPLAAAAVLVAALALRRAGDRDAPGAWIETGAAEEYDLSLGDVSRIQIRPRTRLQVRRAEDDGQLLYLQRGAIEATVSADARPRFFQVETDAARCVDLGCRYTLEVDDDGVATVNVTLGQVAFEVPGREVFVPAGATAVARPGRGPGTPSFEDARPSVRAAFAAYDDAWDAPADRRADVARKALATVRDARDTLAAWHLLQDPDPAVVREAAARLEAVAGACEVPAGASPEAARAAWKDHLSASW